MLGEGVINPSHITASVPGPTGRQLPVKKAPEEQDKGTPVSKSASMGPQLKCLYTNCMEHEKSYRPVHACRAMMSLALLRHGGVVSVAGIWN